MSNYTTIRNIKLFTKSIRKNVVMIFPRSYHNVVDSLISLEQTESLVRKYIEPSYNDEFIISEDNYDMLCNEIRNWVYNSSLSQAASCGTIECAWDDDINDMVFWHPESTETFSVIR
jgi:hypothetical protein